MSSRYKVIGGPLQRWHPGRDKSRPYIGFVSVGAQIHCALAAFATALKVIGDVGVRFIAPMLLVMLLLAGCGEPMQPTITPEAATLNFFFFLHEGATDNAQAYWLPRLITAADEANIAAAANTLHGYDVRNPQAMVTPLPVTPTPNTDEGASVSVTVTAELRASGGDWQPAAPVLQAQMVSTSIGWRVRDFTLLIAAKKKGDY